MGSVRLRMTVAATVLVTIAMLAASWLLVATVRSSLRGDARDESGSVLNEAYHEVIGRLNSGYPIDVLPLQAPPGFAVLVVDDSGRVVAGSAGAQGGQFADVVGGQVANHIMNTPAGDNGRDENEQHAWFVNDRVYDFVQIPVGVGSRTVPIYVVAIGPAGAIAQSVHTLRTTLWWAIPALIVLIGLIAWGVTGRALKPVETIRAEVDSITDSNLDQRVSEPRAQDEVGRLARTMNSMLGRLQDAADRQRQFVSDASHELRSPVAAMRATGEVALAHPEQSDWPGVVRRMLTEDDRMDRIVSDLLDLARGEGAEPMDAVVDVDDIALEEAQRARASGVRVLASRVSAGRVRGSREQLVRVVRNLLENATRHAEVAARISLATDDGHVTLIVEDDGAGIPPEDRLRVFERFTRLDEGRARDAGGLGLGLAMVKAIAVRHGGSVTITDPVDPAFGGARVVVTLPRVE